MKIDVYLELAPKRTFAGALDWPGWCRSGRDEASAIQALLDYAPRYAAVVRSARLGFKPPADLSAFVVVERLKGDFTTDFGTPGIAPAYDRNPLNDTELRRLQSLLKVCWRAFDAVAGSAKGRALRSGPRGGGRDRQKIINHALGADHAYLRRIGINFLIPEAAPVEKQLGDCRQAMLIGLASAAHGELPAHGPRGALYWSPRYFVRRVAWHVLDHAWEIEDRLE